MVRFKNRWLLVELISPLNHPPPASASAPATPARTLAHLEGKHIWSAVKQSVLAHFGDVGWGAVGLSLTVKYYSPTTNMCIIRVARDHHRIAWGAVTMLSSIEGVRCIPHVIHVSGTIKHAQLSAITHNREIVARYRALAKLPAAYQDSYEAYLEKSTLEIEALQD